MREPFRDFLFADRGSAMYFRGSAQKKRSPRAAGQRERERSKPTGERGCYRSLRSTLSFDDFCEFRI